MGINFPVPRRPSRSLEGPVRVIGYLRVSTAEQAESGAGLAAQRTAIEAEVQRRGWQLLRVEVDAGASGKVVEGRAALAAALSDLRHGSADALMVSKLDRLSRSLLDFAEIMKRAQDEGWNLVALDLGIDLGTPAGEFLASVMASAAQWERRIISQRTRDALAARKASGQRLGRPSELPTEVATRIRHERDAGLTYEAIATGLMRDGVPTSRGKRVWYPNTVRQALLAQPQHTDHVEPQVREA